VALRKKTKELKFPISILRTIIKKFQSTKEVMNLEESLSGQRLSKDHRWRVAEISSV